MVTADREEAVTAVAAGGNVVWITDPATEATPRRDAPGPGRMAVMVGDPGDPAVWAAAAAMEAELFARPATAPPSVR